MDSRSVLRIGVLGALVLTLVTGCPSVQPENAITWGLKASTNQLTQTTPTEWQAIATKVDELVPESDVSLTDDQAAAIVDFVQDNELDSIQEIADLVEEIQADPSAAGNVVVPDSVLELFSDFDFEAALDGFLSGF